MAVAAATPVAAATAGMAAARRLVVFTLLCVALGAAMPSQTKDANEAVSTKMATADTGDECVSGHRKVDGESDCGGNCYCLGGNWVCPECVNEGPTMKKLRSEDLEPLPLKRNKRETSDVTAIVIAERCVPHTRFRMDCNTCLCPTSGIQARASCTTGPCPTMLAPATPGPVVIALHHPPVVNLVGDPAQLKEPPTTSAVPTTEGTTMPPCTWEEKTSGNTTHCVPVPLDGERCAPGVTYMDECNTCICSQDGIKAHASCTFKVCPK